MTSRSQHIAIVGGPLSVRWSCAKVPTVRNSGSTLTASNRKTCLRNGTVKTVRNKGRKLGTLTQEASLSTNKLDAKYYRFLTACMTPS